MQSVQLAQLAPQHLGLEIRRGASGRAPRRLERSSALHYVTGAGVCTLEHLWRIVQAKRASRSQTLAHPQ
jgi:hypothetical protein